MKKPRIFIAMHYLELGGAEAALIGLLQTIDPSRVDIDLFLYRHSGSYLTQIPDYVNLLPEIRQYASLESPIFEAIKRAPIIGLKRVITKYKFNRYLKKGGSENCASHFYMDNLIKSLPSLQHFGEYDLAISFLDPPHVVQDKVKAKKKIEWIHTDFNTISYDRKLTYSRWAANDKIISISDDISNSFGKVFPDLKQKIYKIENIISDKEIFNKSFEIPEEYSNLSKNLIILCTVGRLNSTPKNMKSIPVIAKLLKDEGLKFNWFIIGPGEQESLKEIIRDYGIENEVKLLGPKNNPYPFIRFCNIYIQPSLYEGKSIAVREAQILCRPVIITNYPTSSSQVKNGLDGIICGLGNQSIAYAILELVNDTCKQDEIKEYLSKHDYCLKEEVEKLYHLINE